MEQEPNKTSNNVKQSFRDLQRKYFKSDYSFRIQYKRDEVYMLMNFSEINNLKEVIGAEEYRKTAESLEANAKLYSYANLITDSIKKMQDAGSELMGARIKIQNEELMRIASLLPATDFRVMRANFILINNCDLRNISVPKDDWESKKKYPSYLNEMSPRDF